MSLSAVTRSQILLLSGHAGKLLLAVASVVVLGRMLAPADFGFVALVTSLYIAAIELLDMGTTAVATREIAREPGRERETLAALLALRRAVSLVLFAVLLGLAFSSYASREDHRLALVVAALGVLLLHQHGYRLAFQMRQAYGRAVALGVAIQAGFLLASVAALRWHAGGAAIAILIVVREVSQALASRAVGIRTLGARLRVPWRHPGMVPLLKAGWMVGVAGAAYRISTHAGGFILWEFGMPEALATFSAAQKLFAPLTEVAWLFATPLIASMNIAAARSAESLRIQLEGFAKLLLGLSAVVAVAGYFVAPFLLRLVYGDHYASGPFSSVATFRWLTLGILFAVVTPVLVVGEMARGNLRALLLTGLACLGLNVAGNAWAIPTHGAAGVAMVLCASEALVFAILLARCVARGDARLGGEWIVHLAPALALGVALSALDGSPVLQLATACGWGPVTLWLILKLPAQRARRASLASAAAQFEP